MQHRNDDTGRSGGLSTDDLAQPAGGEAGRAAEGAPAQAPTYPGEATATPAAGTESRGSEPTTDASEAASPEVSQDEELPQLLTDDEERGFRDRWQTIQNRFVDDPREAVHDADTLVAEVMQTLATTFAQHKKDLEGQWGEGEKVDTEQLRGALRRYRSFFNRLLST
ncbi:hypothetical protein [Streptomyces sp. Caat 7-52]|uniref:hypothetical protein n=1 Tax=Streptomyces sp. Caat 7-52 TaxID=2949637 RepID=UPI0020353AA2|nr:hypothetical protein [Streptomyces sp. Caat 7-52]